MKMKPILFNTDMVRAILDGRKVTTRRLVKGDLQQLYPGRCALGAGMFSKETRKRVIAAPFNVNDILYVREAFCPNYFDSSVAEIRYGDMRGNRNAYKADYTCTPFELTPKPKWKPSIHMPKEAARVFLRVKDVRVERLQDMPHDGPKKEGIHYDKCPDGFTWRPHTNIHNCYISPMGAMKALWDSTVKKSDIDLYGWDANPYVWVITFERIDKEVAYADRTN